MNAIFKIGILYTLKFVPTSIYQMVPPILDNLTSLEQNSPEKYILSMAKSMESASTSFNEQ